jgi:hypothetical protein
MLLRKIILLIKRDDVRNYILIVVLGVLMTPTFGQYSKKVKERRALRYGIKLSGGAILARAETTYIGNEKDQVIHQIELSRALPQYNVGLWAQKRFGWLYAEGNLLYTHYGMTYNVTTYTDEGKPVKPLTEKFGYLDMQYMGGITANGFRLSVGPVMHILVNQSSELKSLENYNQKLRRVSYGFSGAIGYDIGKVSIDIKFDKAFRTIGDHIYYSYRKSQFLETPDGLTFAIAYSFAKQDW